MQTPASQFPAGSRCIAAASSRTTPACAAPSPLSPSTRYLPLCHLAVLGDQLLAPVCPRAVRSSTRGHTTSSPAFQRRKVLLGSKLPACSVEWVGAAERGVCAAFKEAQLRAEPWPSGEHGQNTALSSESPPCCVFCCCCFFL